MNSTSKAAHIAQLETRIEELRAHIALATQLEKPAIVALFTRETARIEAQLAPLHAECAPKTAKTKTPCAWAAEIRRCFAIARERGLDTKNDTGFRRAVENFLCREVPSREVLDGTEWREIGDAIKSKRLAW